MKACKKHGTLFVISAPSGAGKTTLCERLVGDVPHLACSVSMTTRQPRPGERHGRDYLFASAEEFARCRAADGFLEYARVFGCWYGTPRSAVETTLCRGTDVILNIDVQGAMKIRRRVRREGVFIFIMPPSLQVLKQRLQRRDTDSRREITRRLEVARREMTYVPRYDYVVINDQLEQAYQELRSIIIASRCRVRQCKETKHGD